MCGGKDVNMNTKTDIVIAGTGISGLFCALNLPKSKKITMVTKKSAEENDSYLAQGGICVLKSDDDYDAYFEDTMRAGHYENNKESVDIMLKSSKAVIEMMIEMGVEFERDADGNLRYTREGAHSSPRILFHKDITGEEITSKLLKCAKERENITITEHYTMLDIIEHDGECRGIVGVDKNGEVSCIEADYTVLATGGIGGLYEHSTNYPHLTGDALAVCIKHNVKLQNIGYIQIHPTTFYTEKEGRRFLISESVRGEGAVLLNKNGERFVDELLPRDIVSAAIFAQMEKDEMPYVRLSLESIAKETILSHFPNIYSKCLEEGYDITKEPIPIVPGQHYFMGGIKVNQNSKTTMDRLYAVGETACNGVHGKNRLASNSLLESAVFAQRAAWEIRDTYKKCANAVSVDTEKFKNFNEDYKQLVLDEIEKERKQNEQSNNENEC